MFNLFSKSVGIQITPQALVAVSLAKDKHIPKLDKELRLPLPEGCIDAQGEIQNPEAFQAVLTELKTQMGTKECAVSIPTRRTYNAVLHLPEKLSDRELDLAARKKAQSLLPLPLGDLVLEVSILRGGFDDSALVFVSGVEKKLIQSYESAFKAASWTKTYFVEEGLALMRAVPVRFPKYPALIFAHSNEEDTLLTAAFHKRRLDSLHSKNLGRELPGFHTSFFQQTNALPTHVIVSGEPNSIEQLRQLNFKNMAPELVEAQFQVQINGEVADKHALTLATGLALGMNAAKKKGGLCLIDLLD